MNKETVEPVGTEKANETARTFRFGVTKFGKRNHSAWTMALPAGIGAALCFGAVAAAVDSHELAWGWILLIFTLCLAPVCTALVWSLIVDRNTIPGASRSPEDNVENAWLSKAAETTALVTFAVAGVGSAVATFVQPDLMAVPFTLLGVCTFMGLTFAVAYLWEKSR